MTEFNPSPSTTFCRAHPFSPAGSTPHSILSTHAATPSRRAATLLSLGEASSSYRGPRVGEHLRRPAPRSGQRGIRRRPRVRGEPKPRPRPGHRRPPADEASRRRHSSVNRRCAAAVLPTTGDPSGRGLILLFVGQ